MAMTEIDFHADPAFRPPPLWARSPIEPSLRVALFAATLLYALLFAGLTADLRFAPASEPVPQEIPVEIVPEPEPPPPQAQEPPAPKPIVQPEEEKPAYDAPRAGTADHDAEVVGKTEKPPPAPTPPPDQKPDKPQDNPKSAEAAADPQTKPPDSETSSPNAPPAPVVEGETPPPQVAKVDPNPPARAPAKFSLPTSAFEPVPDVDFGAAAMRAPVSGGQARARYLTILMGLIRPHIHKPAGLMLRGADGSVDVYFAIDAKGRLTERWVMSPSGSRELDNAVFEAIAQASPFPPPPSGRPDSFKFHFDNE